MDTRQRRWLFMVIPALGACAAPPDGPGTCADTTGLFVASDPRHPSSGAVVEVEPGQGCDAVDEMVLLRRDDGRAPAAVDEAGTVVVGRFAPEDAGAVEVAGLPSATDLAWGLALCRDGECELAPQQAESATETEVWYLPGLRTISADGGRVIEQNRIGCVDIFRYPEGFSLAGHLGIYYIATGGTDDMRFVRSADAGWQSWNDTRWTDSVGVAVNARIGSDFAELSCPWVVPGTDGEQGWISMFVEVAHIDEDGGNRYTQTAVLRSVDDVGDDFGLACTGGDCSYCFEGDLCDYADDSGDGNAAGMAFTVEGTGAPIRNYGHGRFLRDEFDLAPWNPATEDMHQLITVEATYEAEESCELGMASSDVVLGSRPAGEDSDWTVDTDEDGCPVVSILDNHDPSIIHRGVDDAFKAYTLDSTWSALSIFYSEDAGRTWGEARPVEIYFDNGAGEPDFDAPFDVRCMEDQDHLVWNDDGTRREMMVFSARSHDVELGCFPAERNGFVAGLLWN